MCPHQITQEFRSTAAAFWLRRWLGHLTQMLSTRGGGPGLGTGPAPGSLPKRAATVTSREVETVDKDGLMSGWIMIGGWQEKQF